MSWALVILHWVITFLSFPGAKLFFLGIYDLTEKKVQQFLLAFFRFFFELLKSSLLLSAT